MQISEMVLLRKILGELLGTAVLVLAIVGSGTMAQSLTGDVGLQLLINSMATSLALFLLIVIFEPISGSHFNPIVTGIKWIKREIDLKGLIGYLIAQFSGALIGVGSANFIFERSLLELSSKDRLGSHLLLSEVIATAGLMVVIFSSWLQISTPLRATLIASWIGSAYFFTSSTSLANPAVTFGRMWSDTFSGISPASVPPFIAAQLLGGVIALAILYLFLGKKAIYER
jgi:glycerol uptake facilitator-like aquaporin